MTETNPGAPALYDVRAAAKRLAPYIIRTPLVRLNLAGDFGEIYLKLENLQPIGAYKVRSMGNVMLSADPETLRNGVYTASSGNAGLAMAWMARHLGVAARVYAPQGSPAAKLDAIEGFGAEICLLDADEWWQIIENRGHSMDPGVYVDAVRDELALAGNATIGLEIIEQLPDVETVIVPFGGGGVICGIAAAVGELKAGTRIIAAESEAAAPVTAALKAGRPVTVPMHASFISGVGAPSVLSEMWPLIRKFIDDTRVVPVSAVTAAIRAICRHNHVIAEGAGAIPVAAALAEQDVRGKTVCVITGGNIDLDVLAQILRAEM
ncbi:MAG: pyridoxal-phosphate dependent enzyme [Xanthomonadales bacterium]|nr:pyridoxal-phosphate dependent enzyme [Xanthomonadales bacterium]